MNHSTSCDEFVDMVIDLNCIDRGKQEMMSNCTSRPAFYLKVFNHELVDGIGWYKIEKGVFDDATKRVHITRHNVRYSTLYKLYMHVRNSFIVSRVQYEFPPKTWFAVTDEKTMNYRAVRFDEFFRHLIKIPNVYKLSPFIDIFGENTIQSSRSSL